MGYFFITLFIFSSIEVVSKPLLSEIDPIVLTFYRFVIGFVAMFIFIGFKGKLKDILKIEKKDLLLLILLGLLNTFFSMTMLQLAVHKSDPSTTALIFCSNPLIVYFLAIILKRESFSLIRFGGLILAFLGLTFVISKGNDEFSLQSGAFYAVMASISFAVYTVLNKKAVQKKDSLTINVVSFFFGLLGFLVYFIILGKNFAIPQGFFDSINNILVMIYLGVFVSGIGYITFIRTIKELSSVSASVIFLLKPGVAVLFSIFYLSIYPNSSLYIGLGLTFLGSLIIMRKKAKITNNC